MRKLAAAAGMTLMLSACSSSITEPASPSTPLSPSSTPTVTSTPEPEPELVRNPYEAGAERDWSIDLMDKPSAVTYDRQSGTVIVALESQRGTLLEAFSVSNSGRTLPVWDFDIDDGGVLGSIDAASGLVFVQVGASETPDDLIVLNARSGEEELRWSRAHVLDPDVPMLVGAYDSGGGIVKHGRDSVLAAIVEETGKVISDERLFMLDQSSDEATIGDNIVNTHLASRAGTAFIVYPELSVVFGEECWSVSDGIVCTTVDDGDLSVIEYDRRGNSLAVTEIDEFAAAIVYEPAAFNADVTAKELADALAKPVARELPQVNEPESDGSNDADGVPDAGDPNNVGGIGEEPTEPPGDVSPDEASTPDRPAADATPAPPADDPTTDVDSETPGAEGDALESEDDVGGSSIFPSDRIPAMLHDGQWVTDLPADVEVLTRGAPFGLFGDRLINVVTQEELLDSTVLIGQGRSSDMFFEWDGATLSYLRPLG